MAALASPALRAGADLSLRSGGVIAAAVVVVLGVVVLVWSRRFIGILTRSGPIPVLVVALGSIAIVTVAYILSPPAVLTLSGPLAMASAAVLLAASVFAAWPHRPTSGPDAQATSAGAPPAALQWLMVFLYPLAALVLVAVNGLT